MKKVKRRPDDYIKSLPDDLRADVGKLDAMISKNMKGLARELWVGNLWGGSKQHIIGYGDYSYIRSNYQQVNWFIVGLAAQKNYISVYVNAVKNNQYLPEIYKEKLGKVKIGKSSISFKQIEDINLKTLLNVVKQARKIME